MDNLRKVRNIITDPNDLLNESRRFHYNSDDDTDTIVSSGLTKREYFAAMAMQRMAKKSMGEYSNYDLGQKSHLLHPKWIAEAAVHYADALIKELNEEKTND